MAFEHSLPYTHSSRFLIIDLTALSTTSGLAQIKMALWNPLGPNLTKFQPLRCGRPDSKLGDSRVHFISNFVYFADQKLDSPNSRRCKMALFRAKFRA